MIEYNVDNEVVEGFGDEWSRFDQDGLSESDRKRAFDAYFSIFPWNELPEDSVGIDVGCGSGRWAKMVAPRVGRLICIDPAAKCVQVATKQLKNAPNTEVHQSSVATIPAADQSLDFAYSLGVLHHVPDTKAAMRSVASKLKPGGPFLLYLYYDFENRSFMFRKLWSVSEILRKRISVMPHGPRFVSSQILAGVVYWPLARLSAAAEHLGVDVSSWPLSFYRNHSFYVMRTDALDRFGTRLEKRFSRSQISTMLMQSGFEAPVFSPSEPYWVALTRKRR